MDSSNFLPRISPPRLLTPNLLGCQVGAGAGQVLARGGQGTDGCRGKTWGHGELWTHAIMQWVSLPLSIYTLNELLNCCCCQYSASSLASVSVSGIISGLILRLCPRQCGAARKCEM